MPENPLPPEHNLTEYTVSEISLALKRTVETSFARCRVRGEISGWKRAGSGHCYFALKDAEAVLEAVCWRGSSIRLSFEPEDGMEVICSGRLTTYPGRSKYQMVVDTVELAGQGALLKLLEDRKKRLEAEGLFDPRRKRALPFLPAVIGVVTSPTGAVIRDILHRLRDRFPRHVLLWPVPVQGEGAAEKIAAAISGFNAIAAGGRVPRPDLLIVARGGGSLEDLWCFNEEIVVRAAAGSAIPLISAVGHETDVTLIDFAADLRAPTPTAAAEMAVPVRVELLAQVMDDGARLLNCLHRAVEMRRHKLEGLARGLGDPRRLLEAAMQRLDDRAERLVLAAATLLRHRRSEFDRLPPLDRLLQRRVIDKQREFDRLAAGERLPACLRRQIDTAALRLEHLSARLEGLSYERVLDRGFVLVEDEAGTPITSPDQTAPGMAIELRFAAHRKVAARIDGPAPPRRSKPVPPGQGRLL